LSTPTTTRRAVAALLTVTLCLMTCGASSGPSNCTSSTSSTFTNPSNGCGSDDAKETCSGNGNFGTLTGFGFSIPSSATINGIVMDHEGCRTGSTGTMNTQLTKDGTNVVGSSKALTFNVCPDNTQSGGSSSDLWGTTLTATEVNASTFGTRFSVNGSKTTVTLDNVAVTVYYTVARHRYYTTSRPGSGGRRVVTTAAIKDGVPSSLYDDSDPRQGRWIFDSEKP